MPDYPDSPYAASGTAPWRPALQGTLRADVAVVGGGFTGLSAALHAAEAGARTVLLEAVRLGFAASGRNGGQIYSGFNIKQAALERRLGKDRAHGLWSLSENAKALLRALIARHAIACDLRDGIITAAHSPRTARDLHEQAGRLTTAYAYGKLRVLDREETNARIGSTLYHGGLADAGGGHLQPLALALGLGRAAEAAGVVIHETSRVRHWRQQANTIALSCDGGDVIADRVILASDAAIGELAPALAPNLVAIESYLVATAPLGDALRRAILPGNEAVADTRRALDYYRLSADGRLLFAGGETIVRPARDIAALVRPRLLRVFPQLRDTAVDHAWSGTVAITRSHLPHFGTLNPQLSFGYGYSGQGVALSVLGGRALAEAARGDSDDFALLASLPVKPFPGGRLRQEFAAATMLWLKMLDAF